MKRYSFVAPAGVPVEFDHPGRFFTLLNCITPIDVSLQQGGAMPEVLEAITPGIWADFEEKPFTRIRVVSPVDQNVVFMVSMVRAGWKLPPPSVLAIETDLTNVAVSTSVASSWVDLGEDWASFLLNAQFYGTASPGQILQITAAINTSGVDNRLCVAGFSNNVAFSNVSSNNVHLSSYRPVNRFVRSQFTNGSTIQGTSRMILMVMRNLSA